MKTARSADDLLGRTLDFYRRDRGYYIQSTVTVVGVDPEKGIRLRSKLFGSTWVPRTMFSQLLNQGVLR